MWGGHTSVPRTGRTATGEIGDYFAGRRGVAMRVVVNSMLCESNAVCVGIAPEVFELRDDDLLYVLDEHPPEALRNAVQDAVRLCPKQAISIEDD